MLKLFINKNNIFSKFYDAFVLYIFCLHTFRSNLLVKSIKNLFILYIYELHVKILAESESLDIFKPFSI